MPYQLEECLEDEKCLSLDTVSNIVSRLRKNNSLSKQQLKDLLKNKNQDKQQQSGQEDSVLKKELDFERRLLGQDIDNNTPQDKENNSSPRNNSYNPDKNQQDYNPSESQPDKEEQQEDQQENYNPSENQPQDNKNQSDEPESQTGNSENQKNKNKSENSPDTKGQQESQTDKNKPENLEMPLNLKSKLKKTDYIQDMQYINDIQDSGDADENNIEDLIDDLIINELSKRALRTKKNFQDLTEKFEQDLIDLGIIEKHGDEYKIGLKGLKLLGKKILDTLKNIDEKGSLGVHENKDFDLSANKAKNTFTKQNRTKINFEKTLESLLKKRSENPKCKLDKKDVFYLDEIKEAEYVIGFAVDASGSMNMSFENTRKIDVACDTMLAIYYLSKSKFINDKMFYYTFSNSPKKLNEKEFLDFIKSKNTYDSTNIGDTIEMFRKDSRKFFNKSKVLFILTDGMHNTGRNNPIQQAKIADKEGIKLYFIHFPCDLSEVKAGKDIVKANKGFYFQPKFSETQELILGEYFSLHK